MGRTQPVQVRGQRSRIYACRFDGGSEGGQMSHNHVVAAKQVEIAEPRPHQHIAAVKLADESVVWADDLLARIDGGEEFHMPSAVKGMVHGLGAVDCPECGERVPWA